jgi:GUN4-like
MSREAPTVAGSLQQYQSAVEKIYSQEIVERIRQGQDLAQMLQARLSDARQKALDQLALRLSIGKTLKLRTEQELRANLLTYLRQVDDVCSQWRWWDEQPHLTKLILRLNLTEQTVRLIHFAVRCEQYDQKLFAAVQQYGLALPPLALDELRQLQLDLDLSQVAIPPYQTLQTSRKANYIHYLRLWRRLVLEKDWQAANQQTHTCLVAASGRQKQELHLIDVERIPLIDLQTIDHLWCTASRDSSGEPRFGLSVQAEIWQQVNRKPEAFSRRVDWQRIHSWISYDQVEFSLDAVRGHLPVFPYMGWWCWVGGMAALMERVVEAQQTTEG